MHASLVYVPTDQRAKRVPTSYFYVSTCERANKRAIRRANFSAWRSNVPIFHFDVPKGVPIFQTFLLPNAKGNFCALLLYKKFYIILDIIVIKYHMYIVL